MLIRCLVNHQLAKVQMLSNYSIDKLVMRIIFCEATIGTDSSLGDHCCTADGLKIHFQSCHGLNKQSMYYNSWLHGHFITKLFVYSIDGRIIEVNVPDCVYDSAIANMFVAYRKLEESMKTQRLVESV
jgi:hypothetical protein